MTKVTVNYELGGKSVTYELFFTLQAYTRLMCLLNVMNV